MEFVFNHEKESYMEAINVDKSVRDSLKEKKIDMITEMYGLMLKGDYTKSRCTEIIVNNLSFNELVLIATENFHDEFEILTLNYLNEKFESLMAQKKGKNGK